ncbi:MAG: SH3 domain-containing protein [bacterium]|nr:SH3 domain-containing protein [bacterium]
MKICLTVLIVALLCNPKYARAEDVVTTLKEKVSNLKASVEEAAANNQDDSFAIEQEEFDKMRAQLLKAEKEIINKAVTSETTTENVAESEILQEETTTEIPKDTSESISATLNQEIINETLNESGDASLSETQQELAKEAVSTTDQNLESLKTEYEITLAKLAAKQKEIAKAEKDRIAAQSNNQSSQSRIIGLQKELEQVKNKLLISEAEVERLSSMVGSGPKHARLTTKSNQLVYSTSEDRSPSKNIDTRKKSLNDSSSGLPVLTVIVDKTFLRTGPGKDNSSLMEVQSGTRMNVEDRQGQWFRVKTDNGTRAWIAAEAVAFGSSPESSPSQTVKIKSYMGANAGIAEGADNSAAEDKAFDLISKHTSQ